MGNRKIVIGDIHGCSQELRDLLRAADATSSDDLLCVGDLVGKGPDSAGVLEWAKNSPNLRCVLGNHEDRLLRAWREGKTSTEKPADTETVRQLGSSYDDSMRFIAEWPLYLEEEDFLVVHAGINPAVTNLRDQAPQDLLTIRTLGDGKTPWYEEYRREKLVLFGHWPQPQPRLRANAVGLDTGCVYGGFLTAMILPGRRLVSVPARKAYRTRKDWPAQEPR
ncbi:MAG: metallophosphoesterase [Bdellovibrionota bacterium]